MIFKYSFFTEEKIYRLLSKLHLPAKIAVFGIFAHKFFVHMFTYALKNLWANLVKNYQFFQAKLVLKEV